jgi:hypothetical protein
MTVKELLAGFSAGKIVQCQRHEALLDPRRADRPA